MVDNDFSYQNVSMNLITIFYVTFRWNMSLWYEIHWQLMSSPITSCWFSSKMDLIRKCIILCSCIIVIYLKLADSVGKNIECFSAPTQLDCQGKEILVEGAGLLGVCPACLGGVIKGKSCEDAPCAPGLICRSKKCSMEAEVVLGHVTSMIKSNFYRCAIRTIPFLLCNVRAIELLDVAFAALISEIRFLVGIGGGMRIKWRVPVVDGGISWRKMDIRGRFFIVVKMGITKNCNVLRVFAGVRNRWLGKWNLGRELCRGNGGNHYLVVRFLKRVLESSCMFPFFFLSDDPKSYGDTYQRQCESTNFIASILIDLYKTRGTTNVNLRNTVCEYDGAFGSHVIENGL